MLGGFTSYLEAERRPPDGKAVPAVILEAIGGGIWAVIQHEIDAGRLAAAAARSRPEIAEFAIVPFD